MTGTSLGVIVRGSLTEGLEMKLADGRPVEDLRAGRFVVVQGDRYRFFSMLTDVRLDATNSDMLLEPPAPEDEFRRKVLLGSSAYATVKLRPMLMTAVGEDEALEMLPVKTIPPHFSVVHSATSEDVDAIFGSEQQQGYFQIGAPVDMADTPVCLNLERLVERSNGIFGKSGTGKTFLTRLCLCGTIKSNAAVNLVFDMHSEYGWEGSVESADRAKVRGLKQFFGTRVQVFSLDPESSRRRGAWIDFTVRIPTSHVTIDDIVLLQRELNLTATAAETAELLVQEFGESRWLDGLLKMDAAAVKDFADQSGAHPAALTALKRKLARLQSSCRDFLLPSVPPEDDAVAAILRCLTDGINVVLEFGQHSRPLQYMLVANILTRRIHEHYMKLSEEALRDGSGQPRPLVITIEEAHKFLAPELADQTIFGTIAREMRKYGVTLLIVDQRPSGIDREVLSQIGTRMICQLDDENDLNAALSGLPDAGGLRSVLARLESKQQALLLGHAVPMPIVVRTRQYDDEAFRTAMGVEDPAERARRMERDRDLDFPA